MFADMSINYYSLVYIFWLLKATVFLQIQEKRLKVNKSIDFQIVDIKIIIFIPKFTIKGDRTKSDTNKVD